MDISSWHKYKVGKIFTISTTKHSVKEDFNKGKMPYISRTSFNNGCDFYADVDIEVDADIITKGDCISIGAEGRYAFYQKEDFVTGVKVYTLRNDKMNENSALFICTMLNTEIYRYNYGRARILEKIENEDILLPYYSEEEPDWDYMNSYIAELKIREKNTIKDILGIE